MVRIGVHLSAAFFLLLSHSVFAKGPTLDSLGLGEPDPCGYPDTTAMLYKTEAMANWGYGYDSLLVSISRWRQSPYVRIDSIGRSVQQRGLYTLTIEDTAGAASPRKRIWMHARTHPAEVQGTWVTNQLIEILLTDTPLARILRDSCVFTILPMLNPDGVELGLSRQNANDIDLESNWAAIPVQPEVEALRAALGQLMAQPNPVQIALNMHSSVSCTRYFVFHAAAGTSGAYAAIENRFIDFVRSQFSGGFEPWNYFVSWTSSAPTYYPESWFWYNYREGVLALTYEDMNCPQAGDFDKTATALLYGIGDFLGVLAGPNAVSTTSQFPWRPNLAQNYPNPFNTSTRINYELAQPENVDLRVYDVLGREVSTLVNQRQAEGLHTEEFEASQLGSGVYFYRLAAGSYSATGRMFLLK